MNIQSKINKLLMALKTKGYIYKVNQEQFYIEEKNRVCTKYILYETTPKQGEKFYSKIEMLKHLAKLYKEVGALSG